MSAPSISPVDPSAAPTPLDMSYQTVPALESPVLAASGRSSEDILLFLAVSVVIALTVFQSCEGPARYLLIFYAVLQVPRMITLIYHNKHPLELDVFGQELPPPDGTALKMYRVANSVQALHFFTMIALSFSLSSHTRCDDTSPALFWTQLAIIVFNLLIVTIPFIFICALFLCLPCAILLLRWLHPAPNRGAPEEAIQKLPKYTFNPSEQVYGNVEITDATCTICLQEYSDGAVLRVLECRHHYHQSCVDDWFRIQATCPLCVRPIVEAPVTV
ncbi:hypothetical protein PSACC_00240 [Paramicrosporidium saccamoebae]|uniref:RING-type domain-containing protein n=1 Tax=Paramicrosporidium saccamoebae TaxID=1246581 RepID=A0A2H9TQC1_9FUNG|nr:hypothetical protein PSACC_00240 [Paramicrosporidium saccamoebae]